MCSVTPTIYLNILLIVIFCKQFGAFQIFILASFVTYYVTFHPYFDNL